MKRRTILFTSLAAVAGGLFVSHAPAAHAASLPVSEPAAVAGGSPMRATVRAATLPKVTVRPGDTLSGIAARYPGMTWPRIASYDHIVNPDLIYPGQVFTIPPASYTSQWYGPVPKPLPPASSSPVRHYYTAPVRHYTAPARIYTPVRVAAPVSSGGSGEGSFTGIWACIAYHESGGNPAENTGNGYYGGLQFTMGTWAANGGTGNPANASAAEQMRVANNVVARSGGSYGAWPNTSRMCGV